MYIHIYMHTYVYVCLCVCVFVCTHYKANEAQQMGVPQTKAFLAQGFGNYHPR